MIKTLHFAESEKDLPSDWELTMPDLKEGAENYRDFLIQNDKNRTEFESKSENKKNLWFTPFYPIVDDFTTYERINGTFKEKKHTLICLEKLLGEEMFRNWKWNTSEVQSAFNHSKTSGSDWYKQFESNPDGAADYLDNINDVVRYSAESEKIERGVKYGKHENH